jgi:4-amino-4-deoxy-L-arabinose transferase-like glycosyltransferase
MTSSATLRARPAALIAHHPRAMLATFLALQFVGWTAIPALIYKALPLDVLEALVYGREWQLGYPKLPPLPWWLTEAVYTILPYDVALYALSQLFNVVAFAIVWLMARRLVGPLGALAAVLIVGGQYYFQEVSAAFNHNVAEVPFWALAGYALHAALRRGRHGDWVLLGAALGGAFWAKYFVAVLALPILLFMVIDRDARPALRRPGPWIAAAVALLVALPHLIWLVQHDFVPLEYVDKKAAASHGLLDHIVRPVQFGLAQLAYLLPSLLIAAPLAYFSTLAPRVAPDKPAAALGYDDFDRRIVTLLAFGPAATVAALSLVTGRGTLPPWGYPLWLYLGLWLVMVQNTTVGARGLAWVVAMWAAVFGAFAATSIGFNTGAFGLGYLHRSHGFAGPQLASEIERRYQAATGHPPVYVIGPLLEAGNISRYAPSRPRVVIDADFVHAPWIDPEAVRTTGALLVWEPTEDGHIPEPIAKLIEGATMQPPIVVPVANGRFTFHFTWAILSPK